MGTEACGGGKVVSWVLLMLGEYLDICGSKIRIRRSTGGPQGRGRALPPGCALLPRGLLVASPTSSPSLLVCVRSKKDHREGFIPFGIPFLRISKIGTKKHKLALGRRLIG